MLGEVQPFSCLCVFSLSKLIAHFMSYHDSIFHVLVKNLKHICSPVRLFFPFYVNSFLPKSKAANRGSTHILHAGNSLAVRVDNQEPCLRCGSVKGLHQCNDVWAHTECHCFSLVRSTLIFNFFFWRGMNHPWDMKYYWGNNTWNKCLWRLNIFGSEFCCFLKWIWVSTLLLKWIHYLLVICFQDSQGQGQKGGICE